MPPFVAKASAVTAQNLRFTWRAGCPIGPAALRLLRLSYVGFDHRSHLGSIVVNRAVSVQVTKVFKILYAKHFPIHSMVPEEAFRGSDPVSMVADNSSGFNCRYAVSSGQPTWSVHAYGEAIDINPVENPYFEGGKFQPASGIKYRNRNAHQPGMAVPNGVLISAFASIGWYWGGRWTQTPDYQHFSLTGG